MYISIFGIIYPELEKSGKIAFSNIFNKLNKNVYNGELDKPIFIGQLDMLEYHGITIADKTKSGIIINPMFENYQETICTIGHELIHAWQAQHGQDLNHGKMFKFWQAETAYYLGVRQAEI